MDRLKRYRGFIVSDPAMMLGKPVIAGTRITVELILELLSREATIEDMLREYPHLTREGINAALAFAADALQSDRAYAHIDASTPRWQATLKGLWAGAHVTDEDIGEVRREMWSGFPREDV